LLLVLSALVDLAGQPPDRPASPLAGALLRGACQPEGIRQFAPAANFTIRIVMTTPAVVSRPRANRERTSNGLRRRSGHQSDNTSQPFAMLYLRSLSLTGTALEFHSFDASYIENLRAGDSRTQEHFVGYFTELLHLKLRSRLHSPQAIEDVRQETFARVLAGISKPGTLRQPESLGAFVNTVCNNVLFEHYRASSRSQPLEDEDSSRLPATGADAHTIVVSGQMKLKVREILLDLPVRDRSLLKAVFLDERDREEICREFGVDRDYLRVLLHRAKQEFKTEYMKRNRGAIYQENG
jgi:RNA polymerase sigma-70 factor (ECF subfamily)